MSASYTERREKNIETYPLRNKFLKKTLFVNQFSLPNFSLTIIEESVRKRTKPEKLCLGILAVQVISIACLAGPQ